VVLPKKHPLAQKEKIKVTDLDGQPFLLLEHGGKTEVSDFLEKNGVHPKVRFNDRGKILLLCQWLKKGWVSEFCQI